MPRGWSIVAALAALPMAAGVFACGSEDSGAKGGGKVTVLTGDPGEPRKVPAQDK